MDIFHSGNYVTSWIFPALMLVLLAASASLSLYNYSQYRKHMENLKYRKRLFYYLLLFILLLMLWIIIIMYGAHEPGKGFRDWNK